MKNINISTEKVITMVSNSRYINKAFNNAPVDSAEVRRLDASGAWFNIDPYDPTTIRYFVQGQGGSRPFAWLHNSTPVAP